MLAAVALIAGVFLGMVLGAYFARLDLREAQAALTDYRQRLISAGLLVSVADATDPDSAPLLTPRGGIPNG